jgi:hypothetical protein
MELELVISNGHTESTRVIITTMREFSIRYPIVERVNFGYETNEFEFSSKSIVYTNQIQFADSIGIIENDFGMTAGNKVDLYAHENNETTHIYGGIISGVEFDREVFRIKTETHTHGLDIRSTWHSGSGSSATERSVFYQYNNRNIMKLRLGTPGIINNPNDVTIDENIPTQTMREALDVWSRDDPSGSRFWTIRPDGTLYGNLFLPTNLKLVPNEFLISAKYNENWEKRFNASSNFIRALIDYSLDTNAQKTPTSDTEILGSFTASRDYTISGVTFAISSPASNNFALELNHPGLSNPIPFGFVNLASSESIELVEFDGLFLRTIMFDKMVKIEKGITYDWIGKVGDVGDWTGDVPNGKFGNVFNFGSRVKEFGLPLGINEMFRQGDQDPSIEIELSIEEAMKYELGDFVSLTSLGFDKMENPASLVRREFDFSRNVGKLYLGIDYQVISDKIIESIRRSEFNI